MPNAKNEAKIRFTAETESFTAAVKNANSEMASLRAEMRLAEATFKNTGNSAELYESKTKILQAQLQANAEKQEALTGKLEAAKRVYGENSSEAELWARKLTDAQTEQQNLEGQLQQCTQEIAEQTAAEEKARTPLERLNSTITEQKGKLEQLKTEYKNVALESGDESTEAQELKAKINELNSELGENEAKLREVDAALDEAGNSAEQAASGGWTVFGGVVSNLASNAIQQGIDKAKEFAEGTVQLGIDFSSSMSNVQAVSGATSEEMGQLEQKARDLGKSTKFSATDVSDAFGYMAMAGWKTEQMMGGVEGVLNLAAASGEDLATTSDIVTDALTAFGMQAEDSGRLADIMAAASANANTNVSMLGESFKYVAPVAGSMGYSAEDTAVALGLMANAGIKASQGGTALRTILTNMAKPSKEVSEAMHELGIKLTDDEGNMKSLGQVMDDLRSSFGEIMIPQEEFSSRMSELDTALQNGEISQKNYDKEVENLIELAYGAEGAEKAKYAAMLAGKEGMSGLMAIVNASEEDYSKLTGAINDSSGAAENMAKTMGDNLGGDLATLSSAMQDLQHQIFDSIEEPMRKVVQFITGSVIPAMAGVLQFVQQHATAFGILGAAIGIITAAIIAHNAVQAIKTAMNAAEAASLGGLIAAKLASAAASWAALAPYILIVAVIVGLIAIIVLCVQHWDMMTAAVVGASETIRTKGAELWNKLKTTVINVVTGIRASVASAWNNIKSTTTAVWNGIKNGVSSAINSARSTASSVANGIKSTVSSAWNGIKSATSNAWNAVKDGVSGAINGAKDTVSNVTSAIKDTASKAWEATKTATSTAWENIKKAMSDKMEAAKTAVKSKFDAVSSALTNAASTLKSKISSTFDSIKSAMTDKINAAKDKVKSVADKIKGIFPLKVGKIFTGLRLPKIHVSGGSAPYGIGGKGSLPHFSVTWNKLGAIFKKPVVFASNEYGLQGFGEAGAEVAAPLETLEGMIAKVVGSVMPEIDYDRLAAAFAKGAARVSQKVVLDHREVGRAVREMI